LEDEETVRNRPSRKKEEICERETCMHNIESQALNMF
jgi:hypothetical protein